MPGGCRCSSRLYSVLPDGTQIRSELKEDRFDLVLGENFQNAIRIARMGPVIERQQYGLGRKFCAVRFKIVILVPGFTGRRYARNSGFIFLEDIVALVFRVQIGNIPFPSLAPYLDSSCFESPENLVEFLFI